MNKPPDPSLLLSSLPLTFAKCLFWSIDFSKSTSFSLIVAKSCGFCFSSFSTCSCCKSSVFLASFKKVEHPQSVDSYLYCRIASDRFNPSELWRSTLDDGNLVALLKIWDTWSQDSNFCFFQGVSIEYGFRSRNLECCSVRISHFWSIWLHRRL